MKITINFTNEELNNSINLMKNITGDIHEMSIKDEHIVGNFGEIKYDTTKNEITFDLKTAFINAYSSMILAVVNMIKSLVSTYEMFASSWFEGTRDLIAEKEAAERERLEKETESNNF